MDMDRLLVEIEAVIQTRQSKQNGAETTFLCPAHDDHHPSARWNLEKTVWHCDVCGAVHDRDVNAALNILAAGQAVIARGGVGKTENRPRVAVSTDR